MASVVDICNAALGHIANSAEVTSIDPADGTAEADHCARFYPMARDECLEAYTWSFATVRAVLAELDDNPMEAVWAFAYALPNQIIKPIAVLFPESTDDTLGQDHLIETLEDGSGVIYTNVEDAVLKYTYRQEDPVKFTPLFVVALATNLASYLAGPITKDLKLRQGLKSLAMAELAAAAGSNKAQKVSAYKDFTPSHIAVRNN